MPPLQRFEYSHGVDAQFLSLRPRLSKNNTDIFSLPSPPDSPVVLSQRGVIVGTNPLYDFSENNNSKKEESWFDLFTELCVCQHHVAPSHTSQPTAPTPSIVYPIVRYDGHLNNPDLVKKRRKSLQEHLTFRPVSDE